MAGHAGSASNVIAEVAELGGSIRTNHEPVRQHLHHGLRRMASAVAELHNAEIAVEIREGYPPVYNEPGATAVARSAANDTVGAESVVASV